MIFTDAALNILEDMKGWEFLKNILVVLEDLKDDPIENCVLEVVILVRYA